VDDERSVRFALGRYLRARGFTVDAVEHQEEADRLLEGERYDAVVTDLRLSGSDGSEGLDIISHARRQNPRATIVLLTAYGTPELRQRARALGADAVLSKPVALDRVHDAIAPLH
jgi:CheY-like chemotaxis protein